MKVAVSPEVGTVEGVPFQLVVVAQAPVDTPDHVALTACAAWFGRSRVRAKIKRRARPEGEGTTSPETCLFGPFRNNWGMVFIVGLGLVSGVIGIFKVPSENTACEILGLNLQ